jgi:hypothetical protein
MIASSTKYGGRHGDIGVPLVSVTQVDPDQPDAPTIALR